MKKLFLTLTVLFVTLATMAQSPNLMNYQGVARNAVGNVIPNQLIGLRLSILSGSPTGTVVYQECRNVFTNAFGLFNVVVGSAGTLCQTGTIAGVNWSGFPSGGASKYLQVEIDPQGGTNYTNVGSTQMVSVPYALNAGGAAPLGPASGDLTGNYPAPQILFPLIKTFNSSTLTPSNTELLSLTNTSPTSANGAITGTSSSTAANTTAITGTLSSTAPGNTGGAAVRGVNASTNANGAGVVGTQAGSGIGVLGQAASGTGVRGESGGTGAGVFGISPSGYGVYGTSSANSAGFFENTTAANTANTLAAANNGSGNAISGINTGTGRGGFFQVNNAASTANAIEATTNGIGASWGIRSTNTGTNGAGLFIQSNAANTANNVQSNQAGLGTAGLFQATNTANNADALVGTTVTTGTTASGVKGAAGASGISAAAKKGAWGDTDNGLGVMGTSSTSVGVFGISTTGTGVSAFGFGSATGLNASSLTGNAATISVPAGNANAMILGSNAGNGTGLQVDNSNATGLSNTIYATNANANSLITNTNTGGGTVIFARKGAALATGVANPSAIYGIAADPVPATPNSIGVTGVTNNGYGVAGVAYGAAGFGVLGQSNSATGAAMVAFNSSTGYALATVGKLQLQGNGAAAGRVLTSNDATGNATWNTLASIGAVSGSGTLNWVPKWTPNGTTLGNSQIFDDGTNVGVGTGSPNAKLDVANASNTTRASQMINSSTTNPSSTIFAQNNSVGGLDPVESAAVTGIFSPIVAATPIITGPSAIKGIATPNALSGAAGGIGVQGASGGGIGVAGVSNTGTALYGLGLGGASYALQTNGRIQIQGQGAAAGKVLASDATGNATWQDLITPNVGISLRDLTIPQAIPGTGAPTVINTWGTVIYEDGGANFTPATGQYTITVAGVYGINASVDWDQFANAASLIGCSIQVNGVTVSTTYSNQVVANTYTTTSTNNYQVRLAAGDVVRVVAFQNSGAPVALTFAGRSTRLNVKLLSR